jgi:hypothetical protein
MKLNDIQDCLCDLYDVHNQLPSNILARPKDNDGTETTIADCLENVIEKLQQAEVKKINKDKSYIL